MIATVREREKDVGKERKKRERVQKVRLVGLGCPFVNRLSSVS